MSDVIDWSARTNGTGGLISFTRGENPLQADKLNAAFAERVWREGDTMNGFLTLHGDPTQPFHAVTKQYVDSISYTGVPPENAPYLLLTGGTLTAPVASAVPILTLLTSDNGPTTMNGLLVKQGYQGGGLAMGHGLTGWTGSFQYGAETFHDHFGYVFNTVNRGQGQYNNLESVLTIPAGNQSANLTNAFTASVHDYGGHGALASTFYAIAGASNSVVWAQNSVCTDRSGHGPYPTPLTNVRQQIENDYFISHASNTVRGTLNIISAVDIYAPGADGSAAHPYPPLVSTTAVNWIAFSAGIFQPGAAWNIAFSTGNGISQVAMAIGTTNYGLPSATPPTPGSPPYTNITGSKSQPIEWYYTDNTDGTTQQYANLFVDPTFAGSTGTEFRITGDLRAPLVARVDLTIDNLAAFKSVNAAKTASYSLIGLDGQDRLQIANRDPVSGTGVARTIISSINGPCAEFVCANPNSVNDVQIMGNSTGLPVQVIAHPAQGSPDANIGLNINAAGTGTVALQTGAGPTTMGGTLRVNSGIGAFNHAPPTSQPAFTGAKGGNTALASVIAVLVAAGFGTDATTA